MNALRAPRGLASFTACQLKEGSLGPLDMARAFGPQRDVAIGDLLSG